MTRRTPAAPILLLTALAALVALTGCGVRDRLDPQAATGSAPAAFDTAVAAATMLGGTSIEPGVAATGDSAEHALDTADGVRTYHLYVPASQRPADAVAATGDAAPATGDAAPVAGAAAPAPLLLALHGGGGTGTQFEQQSRFDELAEANGFLVAYPDGTGIGRFERGRVWNAGRCCGPAADGSDDPDDVAFLAAVIDDIASGHAVDRDRVVITGHSNGSMMALRFACERADLVAGVASQAGPLVTDGACQPSRPVPVLALHGTADANVPYDGGTGPRTGELRYEPATVHIAAIAAAQGCTGEPVDRVVDGAPAVSVRHWDGCGGGAGVDVGLVSVEGAAHPWMGAEGGRGLTGPFADDPYPDFDSSAAVWSFLAAQRRSDGR